MTSTTISPERRAKLNSAYRNFLRHGHAAPEHRDLITTGTAGASLVPQGLDTVWVNALATASPIVNLVHNFKSASDGRPVKQIVTDSTAQYMTLVAESGSTTSVKQTPSVFSNVVGRDSLIGRVDVSWQELSDSFDLETFLRKTAAVVVGRSLEVAILAGTDGAGNELPNSPSGGLFTVSPTGHTTPALAAGIGYGDIRATIASLDHVYMRQPTSGLLASQSVHDLLAAQEDGFGRPYYDRDPETGNLLINGYQLYVANNHAAPAYNTAASNVLLAGDFSRAYGIALSEVNFRVVDINPQNLSSTVLFYVRFGADALLPSAVKALKTAAS